MDTEGENAPAATRVWLDRTTPPHVLTLVLLAGLGALNMNIVLPSLPGLAAHYDADYGVVALSVSAYLGLTALLQIVVGPLSDRFGRRPAIIACIWVFLFATIGCMVAPTVELFLAFRLLQATIASGIALSRAIVRDMVPAERAASMIGYVTMGMSLAPMLGPMAGGLLDEAFGWQAVFGFILVCGALTLALVWADLGETNPAPSESLAAQLAVYPDLLRSRPFWGYAMTAAFASGAFFAFLGGGPWVASEVLGMSPADVGLYFGFIALGYMIGNFLSGRYAGRFGLHAMMLAGGIVASVGILLAFAIFAAGLATPFTFFGTILFVGLGNGLLLPSANAGVVSVRPELAGSASGLGGALMIGMGALLSAVAGAALGPATGAWPMLAIMLASSLLGVVTTLDLVRLGRRGGY
jgi:DHA1 family bicyclomycin/chloramphenicol resistance-like MFS transporter